MPRSENPGAVASATYRKAVNKISDALRINPQHTKYPSEDLETNSELIDGQSKERAMEWYRRGLRRGFINACDAILEGNLELKNSTLYSPEKIVISVRARFKGNKKQDKEFTFSSEELGFK